MSLCSCLPVIYPDAATKTTSQTSFSDTFHITDKIICFRPHDDFIVKSIVIDFETNGSPINIYFEDPLQQIVINNGSVLSLYLEKDFSQACLFNYENVLHLDGTITFNSFTVPTMQDACGNKLFVSNTYIMSDTYNMVVGPDSILPIKAVPVYNGNSYWTASIPGATWIWDAAVVSNPSIAQTCIFTNDFNVVGIPVGAMMDLAADNDLILYVNNQLVTQDSTGNSFTSSTQKQINIQQYLVTGLNSIKIQVTNWGVPGDNYQQNPAGLMYKIAIQSLIVVS